jgi:hypothetical protein
MAMTRCQHCHAPTQLYLCQSCTTQLANMLHQLTWLIGELDARIQNLDRINIGTIGRNRRPNELNVMDFDAAETARKLRKTLTQWVTTITERHTGRRPPGLSTVTTQNLARWLYVNVHAIARLDLAVKGRHPLYDDIARLVGNPTDPQGGQLVKALNRHEKHFAGTCPTIRAYDGNEPIECATMLYADIDQTTITCPTCKQPIDVERNRRRAASNRDLLPREELLEVLTNIDEPVTPEQLDRWITAKRLRVRGYLHDGELVRFRINEHSIAVYSVARARKLRRRDEQLERARHAITEHR